MWLEGEGLETGLIHPSPSDYSWESRGALGAVCLGRKTAAVGWVVFSVRPSVRPGAGHSLGVQMRPSELTYLLGLTHSFPFLKRCSGGLLWKPSLFL